MSNSMIYIVSVVATAGGLLLIVFVVVGCCCFCSKGNTTERRNFPEENNNQKNTLPKEVPQHTEINTSMETIKNVKDINVHNTNEIYFDNQSKNYINHQQNHENQPTYHNVHNTNEIDLDDQSQNYINQQHNYENQASYYINQSNTEGNSYNSPQDFGSTKTEHQHLQGLLFSSKKRRVGARKNQRIHTTQNTNEPNARLEEDYQNTSNYVNMHSMPEVRSNSLPSMHNGNEMPQSSNYLNQLINSGNEPPNYINQGYRGSDSYAALEHTDLSQNYEQLNLFKSNVS